MNETEALKLLAQLAARREELAQAQEEQRAHIERAKTSDYYQRLTLSIDAARGQIEYLEGILRNATLESFAADGNKKPFPACGVRVTKKTVCTDEQAARDYCFDNFRGALKVDHSLLDPVAIKNGLPFVAVTETPTATIASDLSAYLPKGEDA